MFFLCDAIGRKARFKTFNELKDYIETRHAEKGGFDSISEIKDDKGKCYGGSWSLEIEQVG